MSACECVCVCVCVSVSVCVLLSACGCGRFCSCWDCGRFCWACGSVGCGLGLWALVGVLAGLLSGCAGLWALLLGSALVGGRFCWPALAGLVNAFAGIVGLGAFAGLVGLWRPRAPTCAHMHSRQPVFSLLFLPPGRFLTHKCPSAHKRPHTRLCTVVGPTQAQQKRPQAKKSAQTPEAPASPRPSAYKSPSAHKIPSAHKRPSLTSPVKAPTSPAKAKSAFAEPVRACWACARFCWACARFCWACILGALVGLVGSLGLVGAFAGLVGACALAGGRFCWDCGRERAVVGGRSFWACGRFCGLWALLPAPTCAPTCAHTRPHAPTCTRVSPFCPARSRFFPRLFPFFPVFSRSIPFFPVFSRSIPFFLLFPQSPRSAHKRPHVSSVSLLLHLRLWAFAGLVGAFAGLRLVGVGACSGAFLWTAGLGDLVGLWALFLACGCLWALLPGLWWALVGACARFCWACRRFWRSAFAYGRLWRSGLWAFAGLVGAWGAFAGLSGRRFCWDCGRVWAVVGGRSCWACLWALVGAVAWACGRLWAPLLGFQVLFAGLVAQHLWVGAFAGLLLLGFAGAVAGILAGLGALLGLWVSWACGFLWALLLVGLWRPHAPTCAHMHLRSAARFFPLFPLLGLQPRSVFL